MTWRHGACKRANVYETPLAPPGGARRTLVGTLLPGASAERGEPPTSPGHKSSPVWLGDTR